MEKTLARDNASPWMHEQTWQQIEAYLEENDTVLLPVGATEKIRITIDRLSTRSVSVLMVPDLFQFDLLNSGAAAAVALIILVISIGFTLLILRALRVPKGATI